jgi:hypothetical protein
MNLRPLTKVRVHRFVSQHLSFPKLLNNIALTWYERSTPNIVHSKREREVKAYVMRKLSFVGLLFVTYHYDVKSWRVKWAGRVLRMEGSETHKKLY